LRAGSHPHFQLSTHCGKNESFLSCALNGDGLSEGFTQQRFITLKRKYAVKNFFLLLFCSFSLSFFSKNFLLSESLAPHR